MTGTLTEKDAVEVVQGRKRKGCTRRTSEAAVMFVASKRTVHPLLKVQKSEFVISMKRNNTEEFQEDVVNDTSDVISGSDRQGGTRRSCESAQNNGGTQTAAQDCIITQESNVESPSKNKSSKAFKEEIVKYALEVVPGGKGKGGTRGLNEAGIVYGVPCPTLRGWARSQLFCGQSVVRRISNTIKSEVVRYALEEAASTGNDAVAISNASQKYSVEPAIIKGWIRHSQRSSIIYAG